MQAKILFVHSGNETFVNLDRKILEHFAKVQDFHANRKFPFDFIKYWHGVWSSDLVFCWFASWNSFWALLLAKFFCKPSFLVIGGYDVANVPEANYGSQRGGIEKWVSRWSMRISTRLLPFSNYSQLEAVKTAGYSGGRMEVIFLGVPDPFRELSQTLRARMALTVGKIEWSNLHRKGIEPFVKAATHLPDIQFVVVGAWADNSIEYLRSIASPNVVFTGWVSDEELLTYYRRASVYVQASLHEGFGMSVAEAMLAGCIPVTSRAGSLPEVVGDCGVYCESNSPEVIAHAIQRALDALHSDRFRAREHILTRFPLHKRRELITDVIQALAKENIYV